MSDKNKINAGVVLVTKFIRPKTTVYAGYIDYIDREDAIRNNYSEKWNGYIDYMGNPEKTTGLFTANQDNLSPNEKKSLKKLFENAYENNNLMWQSVISFDNRWLKEQGLYDPESNQLDEAKMKELTRNCMDKMLTAECINDSAIWSASIHYNTQHIHIHVATTEPTISHRPIRDDGEPKGVWAQSTLNAGKSVIVNQILLQQQENLLINNLIRNNIVGQKREQKIAYDKDLRQAFLKIYNELPANKTYWNYNSVKLGNITRSDLDALSKLYIKKYCPDDYQQLLNAIHIQDERYKTAYGIGKSNQNSYADNKEKELYTRLGNAILKEMKEYDKEINTHPNKNYIHYQLNNTMSNQLMADQDIKYGMRTVGIALNRICKMAKKDIQSLKNQIEHEKLEQQTQFKQSQYEY